MKTWTLKSGHDRRFRAGHPWVYSNELQESPKGIEPGEPIILRDASGKLLGHGFGHPSSLIAFRAVGRDPEVTVSFDGTGLLKLLRKSLYARVGLGMDADSFRVCFGEADGLPGLIADLYRIPKPTDKAKSKRPDLRAKHVEILADDLLQVLVIQAQSAGADRWLKSAEAELPKFFAGLSIPLERSAILIRNDAGARKRDGLEVEPTRLVFSGEQFPADSLKDPVTILVRGGEFNVDLWEGQKTGFFLDQAQNTEVFGGLLKKAWAKSTQDAFKVLDLCCYVGQWSVQMTRAAMSVQAGRIDVSQVDASADALALAKQNALRAGAHAVHSHLGDILKTFRDSAPWANQSFDLVIADPPALIQSKKDLGAGAHAYVQIMSQALRWVKPGGFLIACSCSALLSDEEFQQILAKAAKREGRNVQWLTWGGQASDHPMLAEFPEGRYLKAGMARVE